MKPRKKPLRKRAKRILKIAASVGIPGGLLLGAASRSDVRKAIIRPFKRPAVVRPVQSGTGAKPRPKPTRALVEKPKLEFKPFPKPSGKMSVRLAKNERCLSAKTIDAELRKRGSPATGLGKEFVRWGRHYGIRPAVALAFFRKESTWGTRGFATKTKSIGNIRYSKPKPGYPVKYTNHKGFRCYATREDAIRDFYAFLSGKRYAGGARKTLGEIIPVYAPAPENNPKRYQELVVNYLNELFKKSSRHI